MSTPHLPKVAGFSTALSPPSQTAPVDRLAAVQDRLAGWIGDLTTLHDLTERLAGTDTLDAALEETLRAGAALIGARRGLITLAAADGRERPEHTVALGLGAADLGHIETVPPDSSHSHAHTCHTHTCHAQAHSHARLLDDTESLGSEAADDSGPDGRTRGGVAHADIAADDSLHPRHREVAARLGFAASYTLPFTTRAGTRIAKALWLYDEPAEPSGRQRHLLDLYARCAGEHLARRLELARTRADMTSVREELLYGALPHVPGVSLAVRHRTGPRGGGDWYDALPLPDAALGLSVGGVTGSGPGAMAAMGRLRASLRAYAVMEGEDPVAVLSDLELLLRLTEPERSATALYAYAEPSARRVTLADAGQCPPLITGPEHTRYVETTLSAPLGILACWEAPSVELTLGAGETLLLYSDGLLHRTGDSAERAYARLRAAAADTPSATRDDPEALVDHVLRTMLPDGLDRADDPEDVVLLAARF